MDERILQQESKQSDDPEEVSTVTLDSYCMTHLVNYLYIMGLNI